MTQINFSDDYKTKLNEIIDALFAKADQLSRNQRIHAVQLYTDEYVRQTGERPETVALDRMASLILKDELSDPHPDKMTRNEYPIMSGTQREERLGDEISFKWAEEVGQDGADYRPKTRDTNRKMREVTGGILRDKDVHARNKERLRKYREFTKVQPVITY